MFVTRVYENFLDLEERSVQLFVDGAIKSNFPIRFAEEESDVLGMSVTGHVQNTDEGPITSIVDFATRLFTCSMTSKVTNTKHPVIAAIVSEIKMTQFRLSEKEFDRIIDCGSEATKSLLSSTSFPLSAETTI